MENFKNWADVNKKSLGEDVTGLFEDSLRCMGNGIYRAAYLLAYQGMMLALRNKILEGSTPQGFTDNEWKDIQKSVKQENSWDSATFDRVTQKPDYTKPKAAVLDMNESIRDQFVYWRHLRNNCAHYKDSRVIPAHVLTLYAFIDSNLGKISVAGGKEDLLQLFKDYCDYTKYSQDESLTPLINKIHSNVEADDIHDFIVKVLQTVQSSHKRDLNEIVKQLLMLEGEENKLVRENTMKIINELKSLKIRMCEQYVKLTPILYVDSVEVRQLWTKDLSSLHLLFDITGQLILSGKIPVKEFNELFIKLLQELYRRDGYIEVKDIDMSMFENHGYFNLFVDKYLTENLINQYPGLKKNNYHTNFYISHIKYMTPNKKLVEKLLTLFAPDKAWPYTLQERLSKEVWTDENFKNKFTEIAKENGWEIPDKFLV